MTEPTSPPAPLTPPSSSSPSSSDDGPCYSPRAAAPTTTSAVLSPSRASSSRSPRASTSASPEPTSSTGLGLSPDAGLVAVAAAAAAPAAGRAGSRVGSCAAAPEEAASSPHPAEALDASSSSSVHFSSEVSSSNIDVDEPPFAFGGGPASPGSPDSSEAANGSPHFGSPWRSGSSCPCVAAPSSSGWQPECLPPSPCSAETSSPWHSDSSFWGAVEATDVTSTGPPDSPKPAPGTPQPSWRPDYGGCTASDELTSTTTWPQEAVNSSLDGGGASSSSSSSSSSSWCGGDASSVAAAGGGVAATSWECDSPDSNFGAPSSPHPSPPTSSHRNMKVTSSTHASSAAPSSAVNSTSSQYLSDGGLQLPNWRSRASSAPLSLTRVLPTTPPPRPPTPPRQPTPPSSRRRAHVQPTAGASLRRSVSPPARGHASAHSPSSVRRSLSPPRPHAHHNVPVRRSVSPPHPHHAQPPTPPSPTVRRRPSPRPRSARTPSPRPPRPPNSTPEPSPSPSSQQSPRPHYAKMRGR